MLDPLFEVLLSLSVFVCLLVISRLYHAIKVLNERVTNLSSAVGSLRELTRVQAAKGEAAQEHSEALTRIEDKEKELGKQMRRDFTYKTSPLQEMFSKWRVSDDRGQGNAKSKSTQGRKSAREIRGRVLKPSMQIALKNARNLKAAAGTKALGGTTSQAVSKKEKDK